MNKFLELREKYSTFIYDKYEIKRTEKELIVHNHYIIEGLEDFDTYLRINNNDIINKNIDDNLLEYLVFHVGMIELLSYWKCTCSKNIIIKCGYLDDEQISWFKKLYFNGLGEFFYINKIETDIDNFVNIKCLGKKLKFDNKYQGEGNLITIGGGKDSLVAGELLRPLYDENTCFVMNPKSAHEDSIKALGYENKVIRIHRTYIDPKIIELNKKGFLNGHTPFSSLLAFIAYLSAYLTGRKNIILSNEGSANEATVLGTNINHQYSKTYEFELDFYNYTKNYFNIDIKYFSVLRCLTEFQIGMLFSGYEKYHKVFKSCNVGSKEVPWIWCGHCSKCLFVFIILSPFLYKEKLIDIFGKDLFEDEKLLSTFIELLGYSDKKPFECVGTYSEVRYAVSLTINQLNGDLPYLLKYYKEHYPLEFNDEIMVGFNDEHNISEPFLSIVKGELDKYVSKYNSKVKR